MFKNLFDLGYERDVKEAIGFYIVYLLSLMIASSLLAGLLSVGYNDSVRFGHFISIIVSLLISFLIIGQKNLLNKFNFVIIALSSVLLAFLIGGLAGLVPAAYLTTVPSARKNKEEQNDNVSNDTEKSTQQNIIKTCTNCNASVPVGSKYCPDCGKLILEESKEN